MKAVSTTNRAFAALKNSGAVVIWGSHEHGGDASAVAEKLSNDVKVLCSTDKAFAALKKSGEVVAWGNEEYGGEVPAGIKRFVSRGVVKLYAIDGRGFCAVKPGGGQVFWGADNTVLRDHRNQYRD